MEASCSAGAAAKRLDDGIPMVRALSLINPTAKPPALLERLTAVQH